MIIKCVYIHVSSDSIVLVSEFHSSFLSYGVGSSFIRFSGSWLGYSFFQGISFTQQHILVRQPEDLIPTSVTTRLGLRNIPERSPGKLHGMDIRMGYTSSQPEAHVAVMNDTAYKRNFIYIADYARCMVLHSDMPK